MRIDRVKLIAEMARQDVRIQELSEKAAVSRATITALRGREKLQRKFDSSSRSRFGRACRKPTGRPKRGLTNGRYDPLPEHGHRKTGRRNLRTVTPLYPAALQDRQSPVNAGRGWLVNLDSPSPILRAGRPGPGGSRTAHLRHPANTRISVEVPNRADIHYTLVQILGAK